MLGKLRVRGCEQDSKDEYGSFSRAAWLGHADPRRSGPAGRRGPRGGPRNARVRAGRADPLLRGGRLLGAMVAAAVASRAAAAAMDAQPGRATFDEVSRAIAAAEADIVTQMSAALTCGHPLSTGAVLSREPAELLAAVEHVSSFVTHPADLIGRRMRVEESLEAARVAFEPVNDALRALMPVWVRRAVGPLDVAVLLQVWPRASGGRISTGSSSAS
eukprot:1736915-Prymnesium_polylepis.1